MLKDILSLVLSLAKNIFSADADKKRALKKITKEYHDKVRQINRAVAHQEDISVVTDDIAHPADLQLPDENQNGNPGK